MVQKSFLTVIQLIIIGHVKKINRSLIPDSGIQTQLYTVITICICTLHLTQFTDLVTLSFSHKHVGNAHAAMKYFRGLTKKLVNKGKVNWHSIHIVSALQTLAGGRFRAV